MEGYEGDKQIKPFSMKSGVMLFCIICVLQIILSVRTQQQGDSNDTTEIKPSQHTMTTLPHSAQVEDSANMESRTTRKPHPTDISTTHHTYRNGSHNNISHMTDISTTHNTYPNGSHNNISHTSDISHKNITMLSQVKPIKSWNIDIRFTTMSSLESYARHNNVKSPLGSVDVLVPSLRGMEFPQEIPSKANRSQLQRFGRTDAPMLNYIFDTHSTLNKHSHRNDRFGGPRIVSVGKSVSVDTESRAELDCKVLSLQDKLVSWMRRKPLDHSLEILTIGQQTFTADIRFSVAYLVPDTWRLIIEPTKPEDSGSYECQLSTHPPIISKYHLLVYPPTVNIIDGGKDRYYERNSTLSLGCLVKHLPGAQITWLHQKINLNDDTIRGGISVKTESLKSGAESTLQVARLSHSDSGLYTCLVKDILMDTINVHVLNESLAELHQGSRGTIRKPSVLFIRSLFALHVFQIFLVKTISMQTQYYVR